MELGQVLSSNMGVRGKGIGDGIWWMLEERRRWRTDAVCSRLGYGWEGLERSIVVWNLGLGWMILEDEFENIGDWIFIRG